MTVSVGNSRYAGGFFADDASTVNADLTVVDRLVFNNYQVVTTADDTTTTMTVSDYADVVASGSGVLHWFDLGNATTYEVGQRFTFTNASAEIIGVKNSDNTVWERVPPRWGITCVCTNIGSAAGTWTVIWNQNSDPKNGHVLIDDFLNAGPASQSQMGWNLSVSGTGAAANASTGASGLPVGVLRQESGTTATGRSAIYANISLTLGMGPVFCSSRMNVSALSSGSEEYLYQIGILDSLTGTPTDAVMFENDRATYGDTYWRLRTISNSSPTTTATSTDPVLYTAPAYQKLYLEVNSDASRVDFWIDNTYANKIITTIPSGTTRASWIASTINKSVGSTSVDVYLDWFGFGCFPTTQR